MLTSSDNSIIVTSEITEVPEEITLKLTTPLKDKYWRNGRRNLQCFPGCKVYGDYSNIKIEELKEHDFMWGKCRGSLIVESTPTLNNPNVLDDDIIVIARIHSLDDLDGCLVGIEESIRQEAMTGRLLTNDQMKLLRGNWIEGERIVEYPDTALVAQYEFKPKVWKYGQDMENNANFKRRNVRFYCQIEAFRPVFSNWVCIGSGASPFFEVGSSRVLARQKRKAAEKEGKVYEPSNAKKVKTTIVPPLELNIMPIVSTISTMVADGSRCIAEFPV